MENVSSKASDILLHKEFSVPSSADANQLKRLRALIQNAGVDRGSVEIISSDSESQEQDDGNILN